MEIDECQKAFEEWYGANLRGRRTLAEWVWRAAWNARQPEREVGSESSAQTGQEGTYPEEPAQLQTLLDNLSIIQSSAFVNGERVTKAERGEMENFIYKNVGTARAWLDDFAERLGVIRIVATTKIEGQ